MKQMANYTSLRSGVFRGGANTDDQHLSVWA
jgi:hypothetical protein